MVRRWPAAIFFAMIGPANAADLELQRIMLSSGGVGYFEYEATVDGNARLAGAVRPNGAAFIIRKEDAAGQVVAASSPEPKSRLQRPTPGASAAQEPMVCGLSAGGRWIRTIGPPVTCELCWRGLPL